MNGSKEEFLRYLNALATYLDEGIHDYLRDNSMEDYLEVGQGMADIERLVACGKIREFVRGDEFPWWEDYDHQEVQVGS